MTTPKGPSKPGSKPFLGDEDLSELDAWVETFDALHGGLEAGAEPARELESTQLVPSLAEPGDTLRPDSELDAPPDLLDLPEPSAPRPSANPAARSFDLGRAPSVTAIDDEPAEGAAFGSEDEDEVFTSASRPGIPAPDDALFDDDIAPPPAPEPPRRGPAIVRRKSAQTATPPGDPLAISEAAPHERDSDAMFSEQTRVADFGELEQRLFSSRELPAVTPDDDDYLDIEVSDEKAGAPEVPVFEPFPTGRRTAHVVRRTEPGRGPSGQRPVVELDLDDDLSPARPPSQPASEEDFSDVAAAVGAREDLAVPDIPRRRSIARGGSIPEIAVDARPRASLDDALAGLRSEDSGEFGDRHPFDEPQQFGDEFGDPDQFDGPDQFANPQPFAEPSGFGNEFEDPQQFEPNSFGESNQFGGPTQFDEPQRFDEPNRFAATGFDPADPFGDPDQFDEPHVFDEPRPAPALPPLAPPPPLGDRASGSAAVRRPVPTSETVRGMSISQIAEAGMLRPPAITDLYARVKTPTSVPPIGSPAPSVPSPVGPSHTILEFGLPSRAARPSQPPPQPPPLQPVSQPGLQIPALPSQPPRSTRLATPLPIDPDAAAEVEPGLDLESIVRTWPEQVAPLPTATLDEACAQALLVYEREIATVDDSGASAALRVEAGRLCERLTDFDRARGHYDAALMLDPRATAALRGMRRLARTSGDLAEAIQLLDAEIAVAGALERRPLSHYRVDLMMASNEQDLARVAAGEILDQAPSDVRALLAQLELAFLDGRADEFGVALEQLAQAVSDSELRAALQSARGVLAAHHNDTGAAAGWFAAAAESDPTALAALLGAVRQATAAHRPDDAARALLDLARQIEPSDPVTAAAAAIRAHLWAEGDTGVAALALAAAAAPSDPLVARLAAHHADAAADPVGAANAFIHWAHNAGSNAERAYAAARAAELDPGRGNELWASAIALDPGDDYAAAQLRTAHVAADATQAAIDVDLEIAVDAARERARLRAAYGMIAQGQLDAAIEVLQQGRAARPASVALSDALGEALAAAGKWTERAKLFAELADEPGEHVDKDVAQLRSALAWEEAVGAVASAEDADGEGKAGVVTTTAAALDAWERVLERGSAPSAHAAAIVLASRLGDSGLLGDALARAQSAEHLPLAAASLALRRARLVATEDPHRHETILRDLHTAVDDPRRTVGLIVGAARRQELADAAAALEERAQAIEARAAGSEVAALRLRAAQLALDAGEAARATALLLRVEQALPQLGVVPDLLAAARRRAGDRPLSRPGRRPEPAAGTAASAEAFARVVRDADLAMSHGDAPGALVLYQRALELRPGDPLAAVPLVRVATQLREPAPLSALALAQLRVAEDAGDRSAKAAAYELLAQIDSELRADAESAQQALESAAQVDPTRIDLLHRLERHYAAADQLSELIRLRTIELDATPEDLARDRVALLIDLAGIAGRDGRPELELADLYRRVLGIDPRARLALLHLESIIRRSGFSPELAELEERIAVYFDERSDARTQAAFWTRAGETLAEIGKIDEAVQRFGKAEAALPGHVPALEGWRQAALKGQLWIDVAEAATRQAAGAAGPARAALHHFAGVALMDKALSGEQAMAAFRRALEADHGHRDAFLRLRILLEEDANHDELATLLAMRLDVETDPGARIDLHRALAELHRNFLSDRDTAKRHYRAILDADASDLRAHAAVADIAWEQGNWQEAADALMARAKLERAPDVLKTLCFRLGLIYADRLVDVPMALKAFQRALTYQPDDENTLIRLADLATQVGEWKLALGACERLVKNESDPDRRAAHLHRVARIFKHGFGDNKRAERALNLALDGAPTNDEALAQLVQFYRDANDLISVRVHLNRVAGAMRARVTADPQDGVAYRVISRAMTAREAASVAGSLPIARAAGELAELLGTSGDPEQRLLQASRQPDLSLLTRSEADDVLFPRGVPSELRQIFHLLGDRIAKHVGVDLRPYGVTRGDRLRGRDNPVAAVAQGVATGLGFGEIDVYISNRQPWVMVAEPTSPVSLLIGTSIAKAGGDTIRFAAGDALKLAQAQLAIAARLPVDDLGVLVVGLLRLFQPDFPIEDIDGDAVAAQAQKLRRLIPTGVLNELRPYALAIDPQRFRHTDLARDLKIAGLRAGLIASGSLLAGLRILSSQTGGELPAFLADPLAQGLVAFALGEDHAVVAR
ncbi:MAG TPA: hypothetical protein VHT91_00950 [Kofleriaceae bacterium]|jgi:hypothetical protein|nr:hypothetical protein [Kofleriaceae bacterium]